MSCGGVKCGTDVSFDECDAIAVMLVSYCATCGGDKLREASSTHWSLIFALGVVELPPQKKKWELTQEALDRLLAQLDSDREQAGAKLESIRRKLMKFFECRGCLAFEDYADQTIDRVAQKVVAGEIIRASDPSVYFLGVARNLLKEFWRAQGRQAALGIEDLPLVQQPVVDPKETEEQHEGLMLGEQRLKCLRQCLQNLSSEDRESVLQYYQSTGRTRIDLREILAQKFAISSNALRIRMHRLRQQLETCVEICMTGLPKE